MPTISRRNLLAASASAALATRIAAASTPEAAPQASPVATAGLPCGIKYDLGVDLARNERSRPASHEAFYRDELSAIRDQLHVPSVNLYGSDPTQLTTGLNIAADLGFDVFLQTRLNYLPQPDMIDRLATVAIEAERLRADGLPIVLDVGCEYLLFADDLIEGNDFFEKMERITANTVDWEAVIQRFGTMMHALSETARSHFNGPLTYSDTPDMDFVWEPFDIISIDHYLSSESRDTYVETIDTLAATGKPVWVAEFGSPPWQGATEAGGMAWDIVDYTLDPPEIVPGIVRDEAEQARAIIDTLERIGQSRAERAYLYEFITTGSTRSTDPRYDYDLTGYGIVSTWGDDHDQPYDTTGHWEPKEAFHHLATWNQTHR